jgi:hypothetical protein
MIMANDRQAQPQAAGLSRRASLGLTKAFKHKWKKIRPNPDPGVADDNLDV